MSNHPYHLVNKSPWPLLSSMSLLSLTIGLTLMFKYLMYYPMIMGLTSILLTMILWWRDIIRESTFQGMHTNKVIMGLKIGMILFIISEVMFFSSFFWAFFHSSLSPSMEIGMCWPPKNIKTFNPMNIPMLNTMILLTSGITMTWAHSSIILNNISKSIISLLLTITLGMYFTLLQWFEYYEASYTISDSIFGSTFFMSTGFHGIHVIIGTMFIMISTTRIIKLHYSNMHHIGFEMSAWYWHFVDVVWLFLYISVYWWSN